jgi:hypothetical protein
MKRTIFLAGMVLTALFSYGQDSSKVREIGLTTERLDDFNITYRFGTENKLWRISTVDMDARIWKEERDDYDRLRSNYSIGVAVGKEWRVALGEKMKLRYGMDLFYSYRYYSHEVDNAIDVYDSHNIGTSHGAGVRAIVGFNYDLTDRLILGAEARPGIAYTHFKSIDKIEDDVYQNIHSITGNVTNNSLLFSLVYQF